MSRTLELFVYDDYMEISQEDIIGGEMRKENDKNMSGLVRPKEKTKQPKYIASADRWYTSIELRPWVVRALGSRALPFRKCIKEIVAAEMAEHLGAQNTTRLSTASENVDEEVSATSSMTGDCKAPKKVIHHEEKALATFGLVRKGFAHQSDFASAASTQHTLGVQNSPALHPSQPATPGPPCRMSRKGIMEWPIPDLADPDPCRGSRRPASTSASASIPVTGTQKGYSVRSDPKPENKGSPWPQKRDGHSRGHTNREKVSYVGGALDREGRNRGNGRRDEEIAKEGKDVANDDGHEDGVSFKKGKSDVDRPAQKGRGKGPRSEMSLLSSEERGIGLRTSSSEGRSTVWKTSKSKITSRSRSTSRSRDTSSSRNTSSSWNTSSSRTRTNNTSSRKSRSSNPTSKTSRNNNNKKNHHRRPPAARESRYPSWFELKNYLKKGLAFFA